MPRARSPQGWDRRRARLEKMGRLCFSGDLEQRPDEPSCFNTASRIVEYYELDDDGGRVGKPIRSRVCTKHRNQLDRDDNTEIVSEEFPWGKPGEESK
jgi:hypothetical protein